MKRVRIVVVMLTACLVLMKEMHGQQDATHKQNADDKKPAWVEAAEKIIKPLLDKKKLNVVTLGIIDRTGMKHYLTFGEKPANLAKLDEHTLFEIGSITKTMTSLVLAEGIQRSELKLDDPVQSFLPSDMVIPLRGKHTITLEDLATHTSGLPRLASYQINQLMVDRKLEQNPYAQFDAAQLKKALEQTKAKESQKPTVAYSNFGAGLLGYALCQKYGKSYGPLLEERLFAPLGMKETWLVVPDAEKIRFIDCFDEAGKPASHWDFTDVTAGAGGIRSTTSDMLLFLEAASARSKNMRNAFDLAIAPQYEYPPIGKIALAWIISEPEKKKKLYWHNGGTGGFSSFCGFSRDPGVAVVVLSNRSCPKGEMDRIGMEVLMELMK